MSTDRYPEESLVDSTMSDNVGELSEAVVGHRIVSAELGEWTEKSRWSDYEYIERGLILTLDTGRRVRLADTFDCCAYTGLEGFLLHPEMVDHVIVGVGTTGGYEQWHVYADAGDVLELTVGWSEGSGYYGYGFDITVEDVPSEATSELAAA